MKSNSRTLVVLGAELLPFHRVTGLAELGLLAQLLLRKRYYRRVLYIGPEYSRPDPATPALLLPDCKVMREPTPATFESGLGAVLITPSPGFKPWINHYGQVQMFHQATDHDWQGLCDQAYQRVTPFLESGEATDLWFIDWTMTRLVSRLGPKMFPAIRRTVMTVDLMPPAGSESETAWREALAIADGLHLPSMWWFKWINRSSTTGARDEPPFARFEQKVTEAGFGFDRKGYAPGNFMKGKATLTAAKLAAKTKVQRGKHLKRDEGSFLVVMASRFTEDDQKNYALVVRNAQKLLDVDPSVQLRINPIDMPKPETHKLLRGFLRLARSPKYKDRFSFRLPGRKEASLGWPRTLMGSDLQLIPSRWEPFGINALQGMAMGCVPLSTKVGLMASPLMKGDAASATPGNTFLFEWELGGSKTSQTKLFLGCFRRALKVFREDPKRWRAIQRNTIRTAKAYSWEKLLPRYRALLDC